MNLPSSLAAELQLLHYWRRAAATFLFLATTLSAAFSLSATATPQASTIAAIAKIRGSTYRLTTAEIVDLKESGVSNKVLEFIVNTASR